jgi:hypothetical protein
MPAKGQISMKFEKAVTAKLAMDQSGELIAMNKSCYKTRNLPVEDLREVHGVNRSGK